MSEQSGEKSFAPSAKRKQDAARKGDVLRSRELATAVGVLVGAAWLQLAGPWLFGTLETALAGAFATVADVSDARAMIHLTGPQGRDVLAKLCPVDFADFAVGELRRTRAAQVAAALWRTGPESWSLICFRSVAAYLWEALATVSQPGGEVALYR